MHIVNLLINKIFSYQLADKIKKYYMRLDTLLQVYYLL